MALYSYSCHIRDEALGVDILTDIECELEISLDFEDGEPIPSVDAVFIDDRNLHEGEALAQQLGYQIALLAEQELDAGGDLFDRVMEMEGAYYQSRGGVDPDGHWRVA